MIEVNFWGTRGSVPIAHPDYREFGGNTSCVSLAIDDHVLIFDAGTGLKHLGDTVDKSCKHFHLFLSHFHYDHIIGIPFFKPLWQADAAITFLSGIPDAEEDLEAIFSQFIRTPFMPMSWSSVPCQKQYVALKRLAHYDIGENIRISWALLNHPGDAYGYRVEAYGKSICYVTDTEHKGSDLDQNILNLIAGADLVIYDAFFDAHNFIAGWGHSTWEEGVRLCQQAGAKQLAIFHHHFDATDADLRKLEADVRGVFAQSFVARDFTKMTLA